MMENKNIEQQISEINEKLNFITEQMQIQQRKQREFQELKDDLNIFAKDILETAVVELNDVAPYFETDDLVHLMKKFLRNIRSINQLFDYVEGAHDLYKDIKPLSKQMFDSVLDRLNDFDQKGLFEFGREMLKIVDTILTEFSVEDVISLRENIVSIILTLKSLTQPEMLVSVNNALSFFEKMDIQVEKDISILELIKKSKSPEVKKGLFFALEFVKNMASPKKMEHNPN